MPKEKIKLTFETPILIHRKLKAQAALRGLSIKKYLTLLIETDIKQVEEHFLLNQKGKRDEK